MITYDIEFNFYSDEAPVYFSRQATEFDGYYEPQSEYRSTENEEEDGN